MRPVRRLGQSVLLGDSEGHKPQFAVALDQEEDRFAFGFLRFGNLGFDLGRARGSDLAYAPLPLVEGTACAGQPGQDQQRQPDRDGDPWGHISLLRRRRGPRKTRVRGIVRQRFNSTVR